MKTKNRQSGFVFQQTKNSGFYRKPKNLGSAFEQAYSVMYN